MEKINKNIFQSKKTKIDKLEEKVQTEIQKNRKQNNINKLNESINIVKEKRNIKENAITYFSKIRSEINNIYNSEIFWNKAHQKTLNKDLFAFDFVLSTLEMAQGRPDQLLTVAERDLILVACTPVPMMGVQGPTITAPENGSLSVKDWTPQVIKHFIVDGAPMELNLLAQQKNQVLGEGLNPNEQLIRLENARNALFSTVSGDIIGNISTIMDDFITALNSQ